VTPSLRATDAPTGPTPNGRRRRTAPSIRDSLLSSLALVVVACVLAACSAGAERSPGTATPSARPSRDAAESLRPADGQPSPAPVSSPGSVALPASVIDPVVADAAARSGMPADQVVVQSAEAVTFPDAGLGCPIAGMAYPQVQVDGYRIVVLAGETTYDYRGTAPGTFRLCTPKG